MQEDAVARDVDPLLLAFWRSGVPCFPDLVDDPDLSASDKVK